MPVKTAYLLTLIIIIPTVFAALYSFHDETRLLIEYWASGTPKMLIKLHIKVPRVDADFCTVSVERFPTMHNPTRDGYPEEVYYTEVLSDTTVVVRNILNAIPVKFSRKDPSRVEYYESQRYLVFLACVKDNETVFTRSKVVEVFPRSIISDVGIDMKKEAYVPSHEFNGGGGGSSSIQNPCNITIEWEGWRDSWYVKRGFCITWVRGPRLYSIDGFSTRLRLEVYPRQTAVYIEAFAYTKIDLGGGESDVVWESAGKLLTPAIRNGSTAWLSGNFVDRVYFQTYYVYEYKWRMSERGDYMVRKWVLYPRDISLIVRSGAPEISSFPFYDLVPYSPPTTIPPYACISPPGTYDTVFGAYETEQTDIGIAEVTVSFSFAGVWEASLTVKFYRAGIYDSQYITLIHTVSVPREYYWWFTDNKAMTYEVQIATR